MPEMVAGSYCRMGVFTWENKRQGPKREGACDKAPGSVIGINDERGGPAEDGKCGVARARYSRIWSVRPRVVSGGWTE